MKAITRDVLKIMKKINPYTGEHAKEESYNELYNVMVTLKNFGIIPYEDFNKIYEFDHNEFMKTIK